MYPIHYPNQCWNIVNWILGNKFWIFDRSTIQTFLYKKKKKIENIVCEMASICLGLHMLRKTIAISIYSNIFLSWNLPFKYICPYVLTNMKNKTKIWLPQLQTD